MILNSTVQLSTLQLRQREQFFAETDKHTMARTKCGKDGTGSISSVLFLGLAW
jgi:hypothetical protein